MFFRHKSGAETPVKEFGDFLNALEKTEAIQLPVRAFVPTYRRFSSLNIVLPKVETVAEDITPAPVTVNYDEPFDWTKEDVFTITHPETVISHAVSTDNKSTSSTVNELSVRSTPAIFLTSLKDWN